MEGLEGLLVGEVGAVVGLGVELLHPATVEAEVVEVVDNLLVFVGGEGAAQLVGEVGQGWVVLRHE